ncbi:MAG: DUF2189 domain-containing protein [Hyphomicrobiaceae bacterium]
MSNVDVIMPADAGADLPAVRRIAVTDLVDVLRLGVDDFRTMPTHVVFLSLIYPVVGLILARTLHGMDLVPLIYPLATGFALIGPFAAIGLYELSRRRGAGLDTSWRHAFDVRHSPSLISILLLGGMLVVLSLVWVAVAHGIYVASFGIHGPETISAFVSKVLGTSAGFRLMIVGNLVGALFAFLAFAVSVVSFPLLLDRNVGIAVAIATSLKTIAVNPGTMAVWAMIVAAGLVVGALPFLVGLAIVMPVLGHASWHLYQRVIEPSANARPAYHTPVKGRRYAAEFPASLSTRSRDPEA